MASFNFVYPALENCAKGECSECFYKKYKTYGCKEVLLKDAARLLYQENRRANEAEKELKKYDKI